MDMFAKTQTAKVVYDTNGNLTGVEKIDTSAGILSGTLAVLANQFTGGATVVTGAANLTGALVNGLAHGFVREKVKESTGFDPYFGLVS